MPRKIVEIPGIGQVALHKHARSRQLRLTVTREGIRVSLPRWTPYSAAIAFARANQTWIQSELSKRPGKLLTGGQAIGKQHYLRFEHVFRAATRPTSRVTAEEVIVRLPAALDETAPLVQNLAQNAINRALKKEAEALLPPRLSELAARYGFSYTTIRIKSLKRRWGSCSDTKVITLNLHLMELPWEQIDYVLLHELTHTRHMHHGTEFWRAMTEVLPEARQLARQLRRREPA